MDRPPHLGCEARLDNEEGFDRVMCKRSQHTEGITLTFVRDFTVPKNLVDGATGYRLPSGDSLTAANQEPTWSRASSTILASSPRSFVVEERLVPVVRDESK